MPSTPTHILLNQVTLAASTSTVTFSGIPQNFTDLVLVVQHRVIGAGETDVQFNADTGNNYQTVTMRAGASSSIFSATYTANGIKPQNSVGGATSSDDFFELNIIDYSSVDKHKTTLLKSGNGVAAFVQNHAVRWINTAAITSVRCVATGTSYAAGSTFSLYGIVA